MRFHISQFGTLGIGLWAYFTRPSINPACLAFRSRFFLLPNIPLLRFPLLQSLALIPPPHFPLLGAEFSSPYFHSCVLHSRASASPGGQAASSWLATSPSLVSSVVPIDEALIQFDVRRRRRQPLCCYLRHVVEQSGSPRRLSARIRSKTVDLCFLLQEKFSSYVNPNWQ